MLEILVVCLCLIINSVLSCWEMAFVSVSRPRIRSLAKEGNKSAKKLAKLHLNPERTLSVIQIGITLVGAIGAAVGGAGAEENLSPYIEKFFKVSEETSEMISIILVVLPLTYLNVVIGELVPKTLALRNSLKISLGSAFWLELLDEVLSPLVSVLEHSTRIVLERFSKSNKVTKISAEHSSVELEGLSTDTKTYVLNLINVDKKIAKDSMLDWEHVTKINFDSSTEEIESIILQSGHTRLPVMRDDHVVGILHTKEFLSLLKTKDHKWQQLVRQDLKFNELESLLRILRVMKERKSHMAILYEQMQVTGIITLEDIIEEVVGDIQDEDDDQKFRNILGSTAKIRTVPKRNS